jgi:hypothetical protein
MDDYVTAADTSLTTVLEVFRRRGFDNSMVALDGGRLRCGRCSSEIAASSLVVGGQHRLEGASDPSDSLLVIGAPCPVCHTGGALVLGFGPTASSRDADIMVELPLSREIPDPVADAG